MLNGKERTTDKEDMKRAYPIIVLLALMLVSAASAQTGAEAIAFRQEGIASWYGAEFEGRPTASGERFDSRLLTAAHPALPFGTIVKVTNTRNGKIVAVRVNDRGPFVSARIIDLSRAAAEKLDMLATGTAYVLVEATDSPVADTVPPPADALAAAQVVAADAPLDPVEKVPVDLVTPVPDAALAAASGAPSPAPVAPVAAAKPPARLFPKAPEATSDKKYRLQVGSFKLVRNATDAFEKLERAGLTPSYERNGELYRVVLPFVPGADVQTIAARLGEAGFEEVLVREER